VIDASASPTPSYRALLRAPGFSRLALSLLLGRLGEQMLLVTLVLFVLSAYQSPTLAGLTAFFAVFPGLLVSPLAGALLDRHRRARLVTLDYCLAALALTLLAFLATAHTLPPLLLLTIVGLASLTNPLSATGARSLFPLITPPYLWERANAFDSGSYIVSILIGAPLAGALVGLASAQWALVTAASVFVLAALAMIRLPEPAPLPAVPGSIFGQAWQGLTYVLRHTTLRGLALTFTTFNLA
jgi:MFS family permease